VDQNISEFLNAADPIRACYVARDVNDLMKIADVGVIERTLTIWERGDDALRKGIATHLLDRCRKMVGPPAPAPGGNPGAPSAATIHHARKLAKRLVDQHVDNLTHTAGRVAHHAAQIGIQIGEQRAKQRWLKAQQDRGGTIEPTNGGTGAGPKHPPLAKGADLDREQHLQAMKQNILRVMRNPASRGPGGADEAPRHRGAVEAETTPHERLSEPPPDRTVNIKARPADPVGSAVGGLGRFARGAGRFALGAAHLAARRPGYALLAAGGAAAMANRANPNAFSDAQRKQRQNAARARWAKHRGGGAMAAGTPPLAKVAPDTIGELDPRQRAGS